jgi:hypothetical protein
MPLRHRDGPSPGDLIIAVEKTGSKTTYVLSVVPGRPQVRYPTYPEAVAVASKWAATTGVMVWRSEDGKPIEQVVTNASFSVLAKRSSDADVQ